MFAWVQRSLTFVKTMVTTRESRAMAVRNWMNWIIIAWTQCSVVDLEPYPIVVWPSRANRNAVVKSKTWSTHVLCSSYVPSFQAVISPFCHAINQYISPNNNQRPESKVKGSFTQMLARWRYSAFWVECEDLKSLGEFYFRWSEKSLIYIEKTALFSLIFNHLNWNPS